MKRTDLDDFVACFKPENRQQRWATSSERNPDGRWRDFGYEDLVVRDNCSLDLFWLKDESLLDADSLPDPEVIAEETAEDLRSALEQIEEIRGR
jgi:type I restriction enzyme M protein